MYRAARVVGDAMREARRVDGAALEASKSGFYASSSSAARSERTAAPVPDLSRKATSSKRPTTRRSLDRRTQVRQADPRSRRYAPTCVSARPQADAAVVRFDVAFEPVGRLAASICSSTSATVSTCTGKSASAPMTSTSEAIGSLVGRVASGVRENRRVQRLTRQRPSWHMKPGHIENAGAGFRAEYRPRERRRPPLALSGGPQF